MVLTDVAVGGLTKAMEGLSSQIKQGLDFAQKAEKASLALGQTFEQTNNEFRGQMQGLRGDMNERFAASIAGLEAGLQGNTAGVGQLINQQRLTGTQSAKTAATFAQMEMTLGNSRDSTNQLAAALPELGAEWQVGTDLLVGALDSLAKSFPAQKLAGMGTEVSEAMIGLQAELGPSMKGPMESVMSMVMDTSMAGYEKLTQLGIGNVREQLSAAKSTEEAQMILKEAISTAAGNFESVVGDASEGFFQIGVASEIFGESAINLTTVNDAFGERVKKEGADAQAFGDQLSIIKDEIFLPFQQMFAEFFPVIKSVSILIGGALKKAVTFLVDAFVKFFLKMNGFEGILKKVTDVFGNIRKKLKLMLDVSLPVLVGLFTALAVAMGILLAPFAPIIIAFVKLAAVVALVFAGLKFLNDKFDITGKVVGFVKDAFESLKKAIGNLLVTLGEMFGVPDKLKDWGNALLESTEATKNAKIDAAAKEKRDAEIDDMNHDDLMAALGEQLKQDKEHFGVAKKTEENTEKTAENTAPEIKTSPEFLDQTANMLGRSIEGILGITADNSAADIVEQLQIANEQRAQGNSDRQDNAGGGSAPSLNSMGS
jgi:hypothetical protein